VPVPTHTTRRNTVENITTKTIYLKAFKSKFGEKEYIRYISDAPPQQGSDDVLIDSQEITFTDTVTDAELDTGLIKFLEEKREVMRAAAATAIMEVNAEIASLLALENKS
jgi:hypothetical protein